MNKATLKTANSRIEHSVPVHPFYQERINSNFRSPLETYIKQIPIIKNNKLNLTEVKQMVEMKKDANFWKSRFNIQEIESLQRDFEKFSSEGIISQQSILRYLNLEE